MKQGKTHTPMSGKMPARGSGVNTRDSAKATPVKGGPTKIIDKTKNGQLKRSKGSFGSY